MGNNGEYLHFSVLKLVAGSYRLKPNQDTGGTAGPSGCG